jgi:crossover junction endodeoxyribonuclease RuvC
VTAILGIDPGLHGAIACLNEDASWVEDIPVFDGKPTEYNLNGMVDLILAQLLDDRLGVRAMLETTNARPGHSARSTWSQSRGIAVWEGILAALGVPYDLVRPQQWTKAVGLPKKADKAAHIALAQRLYPDLADRLTRKKDDGRADAILVAEYGQRLWAGETT